MKEIDLDKLEDLRDEMEELQLESQDICELFNRDYTIDVDEADLDDELRELDDGMFMEMMADDKKSNNNSDPYAEALSKSRIQSQQ